MRFRAAYATIRRGPGRPGSSPSPRLVRAVIAMAVAVPAAVLPTGTAGAAPAAPPGAPELGPNVHVFDPSMPVAEIQAAVDAVYARQVDNQFGSERDALLFLPGTYGSEATPLDIRGGYYTEGAGLRQDPGAVTINGGVTATGQNGSGSLNTFWRSVSNLTIHVVPTADGCHTGNEMWAVSQAAPMRRVHVQEYTTFMPYCESPNFASGGFLADSRLQGGALNGSQQQFYVRNTDLGGGWSNGVWNQVFSGDVNAPAQNFAPPTTNPDGSVTAYPSPTLETTPVSKEKPYLYVDSGGRWNVFVPSAQRNSRGTTWAAGHTPGRSIPIGEFFVATPGSSLAKIHSALAQGKNLLLTP